MLYPVLNSQTNEISWLPVPSRDGDEGKRKQFAVQLPEAGEPGPKNREYCRLCFTTLGLIILMMGPLALGMYCDFQYDQNINPTCGDDGPDCESFCWDDECRKRCQEKCRELQGSLCGHISQQGWWILAFMGFASICLGVCFCAGFQTCYASWKRRREERQVEGYVTLG